MSSDQMILFFNMIVTGGTAIGLGLLGFGLYFEFFKRAPRFSRSAKDQQHVVHGP